MFDRKRKRQDTRAPQPEQTERARGTNRRARKRAASNQQLQRMLAERVIQPKLTVNKPGDKYEREAEQVADAVMRMPDPALAMGTEEAEEPDRIQRMCPRCRRRHRQGKPLDCPECEEGLRRKEASSEAPAVDGEMARQIQALRGGGKPLPESVRSFFEPRFGTDFGDVRVHAGPKADEAAQSVNAEAFTWGNDVVFKDGNYQPNTERGRKLFAHELAHVVQQRGNAQLLLNEQTQPRRSWGREAEGGNDAGRRSSGLAWSWSGKARNVLQRQSDQQSNQNHTGPWWGQWITGLKIVAAAQNRVSGDIGDAYDWTPGWWYSRNDQLSGWRPYCRDFEKNKGCSLENKHSEEGVVNWGDGQPSCNTFVYDVLYDAGLDPPLLSNKHYCNALRTHNQSGQLRSYFQQISDRRNLMPGDVFTIGGHMEIITSVSDGGKKFDSAGGHADGAYVNSPSKYTNHSSIKFFRVS